MISNDIDVNIQYNKLSPENTFTGLLLSFIISCQREYRVQKVQMFRLVLNC